MDPRFTSKSSISWSHWDNISSIYQNTKIHTFSTAVVSDVLVCSTLFIYLFIWCYNNSTEYMETYSRKISEYCNDKDIERSSQGLIWSTNAFAWRIWVKIWNKRVQIASIRFCNWTVTNIKHECKSLKCSVQFFARSLCKKLLFYLIWQYSCQVLDFEIYL
jgi:hypothetical protein